MHLDRRTVFSSAIRGVDGLAEIERPVLQWFWRFLSLCWVICTGASLQERLLIVLGVGQVKSDIFSFLKSPT